MEKINFIHLPGRKLNLGPHRWWMDTMKTSVQVARSRKENSEKCMYYLYIYFKRFFEASIFVDGIFTYIREALCFLLPKADGKEMEETSY